VSAHDKPTVPRMSAVLPADAARPVEFSADEVELAAGVIEALCAGHTVFVPTLVKPTLTGFVRKLRALGVPPLDGSELRSETRVVKPRALDLCCGGGGATRGLQLAGFHVTGVDVVASPRYCGDAFVQADALEVDLDGYDFIWASPVCKRYSVFARNIGTAHRHPDQIAPLRARLKASGALWCIENVPGAPLRASFVLCGTMFSLPLIRHRLFETSFTPPLELLPPCVHRGDEIPVYGNGTSRWHLERFGRGVTLAEKRAAMGIDWMSRDELSQAIPPVYARFIGEHALAALEVAA